MSDDHGMTPDEIQTAIRETLKATLRQDPEAVERATAPLYAEDSCIWDVFTFTAGMIRISLIGIPTGPNFLAIPLITRIDATTGERKEMHADDADESTPKGFVYFLKLSAHVANNAREEAVALWAQLVAEDAELEGSDDSLIGDVVSQAVQAATRRTYEIRQQTAGLN